jgi:hypothetical protein
VLRNKSFSPLPEGFIFCLAHKVEVFSWVVLIDITASVLGIDIAKNIFPLHGAAAVVALEKEGLRGGRKFFLFPERE